MNSTGPLKVLIANTPPVSFIEDVGNETVFSGFLVDLLPHLLRLANIDRPVEYVVLAASSGGTLQKGKWTGVMGNLTRREADFAAFPLTLTQQRASYIDYTPAYFQYGYGILKKKQESTSDFSTFVRPFSTWTWVALLAAMVFVGLLMYLLDKYTGRIRRHTHDKLLVNKRIASSKYERHMFNGVVSFIGFGEEPKTSSWSLRVLWLSWLIFSVIIMSAYTANLTAGLTVAQFNGGVDSLADLKSSGERFAVPAQSSIEAYFTGSVDTTARSLADALVPYSSAEVQNQVLADVRSGVLGAFISDYPELQYYTQKKPCDLTLADETFGPGQLVIGLPKNSSLTGALTDAMLEAQEHGTITELRRKWLIQNSECDQGSTGTDGGSLTLKQVYSIFVVLAIGVGIAISYALGECVYYKYFFSKVHVRRSLSRSAARERKMERQRRAILAQGSHGIGGRTAQSSGKLGASSDIWGRQKSQGLSAAAAAARGADGRLSAGFEDLEKGIAGQEGGMVEEPSGSARMAAAESAEAAAEVRAAPAEAVAATTGGATVVDIAVAAAGAQRMDRGSGRPHGRG